MATRPYHIAYVIYDRLDFGALKSIDDTMAVLCIAARESARAGLRTVMSGKRANVLLTYA